ncbi:DUF805 domain-containing protein [Sphingomonas sp.]|uniref:DUF805 domain-containing protein n=1 Tax=Sphingomonas sp. TaxID=28214 RepID=UPI001B20ADB4|nr:DUF805 domain-containing protein [Sphingomonas sp.]MBO9712912.1 DUF805 domain-containing protein [Sphingomonas sp.]
MWAMLQGRSNRATYWTLFAVLAGLFLLARVLGVTPPGLGELALVMLAVPRLHDLGLTGWLVAMPIAGEIVFVGLLIRANVPVEAMLEAIGLLVVAILAMLVVLGSVPGNRAANRFGEPPAPGSGLLPKRQRR